MVPLLPPPAALACRPRPQAQQTPVRSLLPRQLQGSWSGTFEWEGRFSDGNHERYRGTAKRTLQVSAEADSVRGHWQEASSITKLDQPGTFGTEIDAVLRLAREGDRVTAVAESARWRTDNNAWQELGPVSFSGTVVSPAQLQYKVTWKTGADGAELIGSSGTLKLEVAAPPASAEEAPAASGISDTVDQTLDGSWTQTAEWEGRLVGSDQRYRGKATTSAQIAGADGGIRVHWRETRDVTVLDTGGTFTNEYEATFLVSRDNDQVVGQAKLRGCARKGVIGKTCGTMPFKATILPSGDLQFEIIWLRDSRGTETNGSRGTLTKQ